MPRPLPRYSSSGLARAPAAPPGHRSGCSTLGRPRRWSIRTPLFRISASARSWPSHAGSGRPSDFSFSPSACSTVPDVLHLDHRPVPLLRPELQTARPRRAPAGPSRPAPRPGAGTPRRGSACPSRPSGRGCQREPPSPMLRDMVPWGKLTMWYLTRKEIQLPAASRIGSFLCCNRRPAPARIWMSSTCTAGPPASRRAFALRRWGHSRG